MRGDYRKIRPPIRKPRLSQASGRWKILEGRCEGIQRMENRKARRKKHLNSRFLSGQESVKGEI